jgi:RNA polymerase sigma-70 factor (ECF subfamily)
VRILRQERNANPLGTFSPEPSRAFFDEIGENNPAPPSNGRTPSSRYSGQKGEPVLIDERRSAPNDEDRPSPASSPGEVGTLLRDVFTHHQDELLGTLYHLLGSADDARDAYQEAFLKCWAKKDDLALIVHLKAWVFRVAINTARDIRQSAYHRKRQSLDDVASLTTATTSTPLQHAEQAEDLRLARQAIGQLRQEEKEVFLLRENGDLTFEQIADQLAIPVGTVKTRMRTALAQLRKMLGPTGEPTHDSSGESNRP